MKVLLISWLGLILSVTAFSQITTAPENKTFGLQPDQLGNGTNTINTFTGDVALPVSLISLPGRNGLDVNVSITYNSNVYQMINTWNRDMPAGILGVGWSMDYPRIVCNNAGTGTREDDEYYLIEGGTSNRLIRTKTGAGETYYEYETKNYQFWKIRYFRDPSEISGPGYTSGPNKWEITKEDGTKYVYGDKNSGRKTIQYVVMWGNWIGNSAQISGQSQLANIWNLSEIVGVWGDKVLFEYETVEQFVGSSSGQKQTEACYLKQMTDVIGRKVMFFYNQKASQYYAEPHTEKIEPDAYQEFYETKYLDKIEVLDESGSKFKSVHFSYGSVNEGTELAKMVLTSIEQRNASSNALPKIKFEYLPEGPTKGFLQSITYPTGGKIIYQYAEKQIGHSSRHLDIKAPAGFAEPMVWIGGDYAVVTWRKMGSGGSHSTGPQEVKLSVYQWVGEWKEQFLQTLSVEMPYSYDFPNYMYYKDFYVRTEKNFFAVLMKASGNTYYCFLYLKDETRRGAWLSTSKVIDVGEGNPSLLSGENFVIVAPFRYDPSHPCSTFTYVGNDWREFNIHQSIGSHYYTSTNNFFISQNRAGVNGLPEINFNFLSEDRKWNNRSWDASLEYSSSGRSYWYSSNGLALSMADSNPEYIYQWDRTYTNFNRYDIFGGLDDTDEVSILNNSLIAIRGKLARYDGQNWHTASITSSENGFFSFYYSYGEDLVVRPLPESSSLGNKGGRKAFDPNIPGWLPDEEITSTTYQNSIAYVGADYYFYGNAYYYRQTNGQWIKINTFSTNYHYSIRGGYPRFDVWSDREPNSFLRSFKNGQLNSDISFPGYGSLQMGRLLVSPDVRNSIFVLYKLPNGNFSENEDPKTFSAQLRLFYSTNDGHYGKQIDFPVTLVTLASGDNLEYTSYDYNLETAVMDPSGVVAYYNEVTSVPGTTSTVTRPFGYTKAFYNNGLSYQELYDAGTAGDLPWTGMPYEIRIYDANDNIVGYTKTTYSTFKRDLFNADGTKVQVGSYVRPSKVTEWSTA